MTARTDAGEEVRRLERALRALPSAVKTALRVLEGENVRLRAMALTYISLFALVPALVVAFSVVQAFTGMERISARVNEFLFENLAVGARATIEPYLTKFVQNAHLTSAGLVGGALLVWSAVSLFTNVDGAVNQIWAIRRRRSLKEQAVIYWVGLTLGPLLLAASVMAGHTAREWLAGSGVAFLARAASAILTCIAFAVLYLIVPNTKVSVRAAALGGLVAGVAWELAKWGYTFAVARIFKYQAIYGSVAAIPIFLLWLYVSWAILLFGARLSYVVQYASVLIEGTPHPGTKLGREILAGRVMLAVARAFDDGRGEPPDGGELATQLALDADDAGEAIAVLRQGGLVVAVADGGLVPARPLERITLEDVRRAIGGTEEAEARGGAVGGGLVGALVSGAEDAAAARLAAVSFRELCDKDRAGRAPARPDASTEGGGEAARKASAG
ncbi:MAG TPA: YhjD/YihY/BrkB family envelope integrity protein [Anaeromyxobacter sp.]|nr:YhjD/YihY/BrkB family envelope integrity protein [Anaeromyxobacter sp.]